MKKKNSGNRPKKKKMYLSVINIHPSETDHRYYMLCIFFFRTRVDEWIKSITHRLLFPKKRPKRKKKYKNEGTKIPSRYFPRTVQYSINVKSDCDFAVNKFRSLFEKTQLRDTKYSNTDGDISSKSRLIRQNVDGVCSSHRELIRNWVILWANTVEWPETTIEVATDVWWCK